MQGGDNQRDNVLIFIGRTVSGGLLSISI